MTESENLTEDERYVYEERLGILGVFDREPTEEKKRLAMEDVLRFRNELKN